MEIDITSSDVWREIRNTNGLFKAKGNQQKLISIWYSFIKLLKALKRQEINSKIITKMIIDVFNQFQFSYLEQVFQTFLNNPVKRPNMVLKRIRLFIWIFTYLFFVLGNVLFFFSDRYSKQKRSFHNIFVSQRVRIVYLKLSTRDI